MQLRKYLDFVVNVKAVPQSRPRGTAAGGFIRFYKPSNNKEYEKIISDTALDVMLEYGISKPTELPVHLDVVVIKRPPDSWSNWRKNKHVIKRYFR